MKLFALFLIISLPFYLSSQVTSVHNRPRSGDIIVKEQVEYKDPGRDGSNVIWDFSSLKLIKDKYSLKYMSPKMTKDSMYIMGCDTFSAKNIRAEDLIIGTEHSTRYYYLIQDSLMYLMGYENSVLMMHNLSEVPVLRFSGDIGKKDLLSYYSHLDYSGMRHFYIHNNSYTEADATGILILPDDDTLTHVTRIKQVQYISNLSDSLKTSVIYKKAVETCRWYSRGYRYPVFETMKGINLSDSTTTFATAFFYPPKEHSYLEDDSVNVALKDSLEKEDQNNKSLNPEDWIEKNFSYNFYPNPVVGNTLYIEYKLEADATVGITLYNPAKGIESRIVPSYKAKGLYTETINCSGLYTGAYVLTFEVNGGSIGSVIIKK